jgi:hypothetical protein
VQKRLATKLKLEAIEAPVGLVICYRDRSGVNNFTIGTVGRMKRLNLVRFVAQNIWLSLTEQGFSMDLNFKLLSI